MPYMSMEADAAEQFGVGAVPYPVSDFLGQPTGRYICDIYSLEHIRRTSMMDMELGGFSRFAIQTKHYVVRFGHTCQKLDGRCYTH